jgi:general secretion pathway protein J
MIRSLPLKNRTLGFTLIEVLLAVAVFAIVLGAINTVFFGALRLRNKTMEAFETALPLQQALNIIQKDLEGIMIPGGRFAGTLTTAPEGLENPTSFAGERVTPDIHTASGLVNESALWADVQKVAYFLAMPTNSSDQPGGRDLIRQVTRNLLPVTYEEPETQWLMSGLQAMRLEYYDGLTWTETWDSSTSTNLPKAIKVQITLDSDLIGTSRTPAPIEMIVPILVQASASSTEEAAGGAQ